MKIAVTSQNFRTVTPHAGRTRRFLVYDVREDIGGEVGGEAAGEARPVEVDRLDLPKEMAMHDFHAEGPHPLDAVDVVIAGSFGEGFAARMRARGIAVVATDDSDPVTAVKAFLARLRAADDVPGGMSGEMSGGAGCGCGPDHTHHHAHGHAHGHRYGGGAGKRPLRDADAALPEAAKRDA